MAVVMRELFGGALNSLRIEPTAKRLRASLNGDAVADTCAGLLVWEPRRVVPTYAIPMSDMAASLTSPVAVDPDGAYPILDPRIPFTVHTCAGTSYDVAAEAGTATSGAFRADDTDLSEYVVLDFGAFDWREEDEPIVSHPHDPFHRIDTLRSDRNIRIESGGRVLAESSHAVLLFETLLPVRFYLPRDDVSVELIDSETVTYCAYKGRASYFSLPQGPSDVAWTYREPLHDAEPVRDRVAFFDERVDVVVDGLPRERPITPWSE
jgi:uncharacterized protein (DUF427 family)